MPRGGKRPGAGRKAERPKTARRVMLELGAGEARLLDALEERLDQPAAMVLRRALGLLYVMTEQRE
jgi:hypothetical protein